MVCIESSEAFFSDDQCPPDHIRCRSDLLTAFCSLADRREGKLNDVGCSRVRCFGKSKKGDHSLAVPSESRNGLGKLVWILRNELS